MPKPKITKIELEIADQKISLTVDEAKALYEELQKVFAKQDAPDGIYTRMAQSLTPRDMELLSPVWWKLLLEDYSASRPK